MPIEFHHECYELLQNLKKSIKENNGIIRGENNDFEKLIMNALSNINQIQQPAYISQPQLQQPYYQPQPPQPYVQPYQMNTYPQQHDILLQIMSRLERLESSLSSMQLNIPKEQLTQPSNITTSPTPTYDNTHEPASKPIQTTTKPTVSNTIPDLETTSFDAIFKEKHNTELQDILTFFYNPSKLTETELRKMNAISDEKRFAMKSTINQYNTDVFKPMLRKYILCEALVDELSIDNDIVWTYLKSRYIQSNLDIYKFIVSRKLWQMLPNEIEDLLKGLEPFTMYKDETYPPKSNQNIFKNAFISQIDVCWSDTAQFQTI